jgi:hypothetical protein
MAIPMAATGLLMLLNLADAARHMSFGLRKRASCTRVHDRPQSELRKLLVQFGGL